jgi:hypothetical protein
LDRWFRQLRGHGGGGVGKRCRGASRAPHRRIVVAIDSGYEVNPDACRAQAESNVVLGLGSILYQEINVKDGSVVESNFHDFAVDRRDAEGRNRARAIGGFWGGHGEPAILPLTAAVCNAIFAAWHAHSLIANHAPQPARETRLVLGSSCPAPKL